MNTVKTNRVIAFMLIFTALFNIADYFLTMEALKLGIEELNPLVRYWINTSFLPLIKVVIIPAVLFMIWKLRIHIGKRMLVYSSLLFSVYFLLMIYFALIFLSV
ncbi:MAG TPA: hypothetical protein GX505_06430 [Clostridiales bacterium]|nr:hypothetical protein [Clostridiales bacterium]